MSCLLRLLHHPHIIHRQASNNLVFLIVLGIKQNPLADAGREFLAELVQGFVDFSFLEFFFAPNDSFRKIFFANNYKNRKIFSRKNSNYRKMFFV